MQFHYDARSSDNSRLSDAEILEAATDLVDNLSLLIEELLLGDDILDETLLPASRQTFEAAFRLAIATTGQSGRRRRLIEIGHLLAQFQPDVGSRISLSPASARTRRQEANEVHCAHIVELLDRAVRDRERLAILFDEADAFARRRLQAVRPPFYDDGTYTWYGHGIAH